ncbi:hypothetical protein CEXT_333351 [Caerostris extrusa]|uniref:Ribosomal protein S2 n=1 Tax=Caerostris extrusa TaxID=172846 RepID=A0AAV4T0Y4_CAEEX|nr:hypothetical protein CEXT_333351 [Caerostris extrusa]
MKLKKGRKGKNIYLFFGELERIVRWKRLEALLQNWVKSSYSVVEDFLRKREPLLYKRARRVNVMETKRFRKWGDIRKIQNCNRNCTIPLIVSETFVKGFIHEIEKGKRRIAIYFLGTETNSSLEDSPKLLLPNLVKSSHSVVEDFSRKRNLLLNKKARSLNFMERKRFVKSGEYLLKESDSATLPKGIICGIDNVRREGCLSLWGIETNSDLEDSTTLELGDSWNSTIEDVR